MFQIIRNWLDRRIIERSTITPSQWSAAFAALPLLDGLTEDEKLRLRELAILFLASQGDRGRPRTRGHPVDGVDYRAAGLPADPGTGVRKCYDGWSTVIVYPSGFAPERVVMDEYGVEHLRAR